MEIPGATPRAGGEVRSAAVAFIFVTILSTCSRLA
jgi:hypothetical protein